jgi:hypothetical protein
MIPVSPFTPLRVIKTALAGGGIITAPAGVLPPVGNVTVLFPVVKDRISISPGELVFVTAAKATCAATSPVNCTAPVLADVTAMITLLV